MISSAESVAVSLCSMSAVVRLTISSSSSSLGIVDDHVEHEPVELRLGQRIRPFLLDRVLRRQHEERLRRACAACRRP